MNPVWDGVVGPAGPKGAASRVSRSKAAEAGKGNRATEVAIQEAVGDLTPHLAAKAEGMLAVVPGHVIAQLIGIGRAALGHIRARAQTKIEESGDGDAGQSAI